MGNTFSIKKWMLNKGMEIILGMDRVELECFQDLIKRMQEEKLLPMDIPTGCIDNLMEDAERDLGKELDDLDSELHDIVTKKRDKKEKEEHKRKLLEQEKKYEKEFEEEEMNRKKAPLKLWLPENNVFVQPFAEFKKLDVEQQMYRVVMLNMMFCDKDTMFLNYFK